MNTMDAAPASKSKSRLIAVCVIVVILILLGFIPGFYPFIFGVLTPYLAAAVFFFGFLYKVINWGRSPVPFRVPTTCGQQKTLPWIKPDNLDNPHNRWGVCARMTLEILFFRSLFKNTKTELREGPKIVYSQEILLWAAAMLFHWSFLIIVIRHTRFFMDPVPGSILLLQDLDGLFQIGLPVIFATNVFILLGLGFLLFRRLYDAKIRYISLFQDYFALILLLCIVISGIWMRHIAKVNLVEVKELAIGLMTLSPTIPSTIGASFYFHIFFVSVLLAYFPFSKLMHMPGVFLSPTRNLANTNRVKRHVNPWNYPVKVHTYDEWEDEFRDKMKAAGMPLEKE